MYHWQPPGGHQQPDDIPSQISKNSVLSSRVYSHGQQFCPKPDIRVLFEKSLENNVKPSVPIDLVLVEGEESGKISRAVVKNFVEKNFRVASPDFEIQFIPSSESEESSKETEVENVAYPQLFRKVALGGTFDRMHVAHKILISEAVLRCREELIIGVTDDEMIKSEFLFEN